MKISAYAIVRANSPLKLRIGQNSSILEYCMLNANEGSIVIGKRSWIGAGSYIYGNGHVTIGNDVLIGARCTINTISHEYRDPHLPINEQPLEVAPVVIENDVWLGLGVKVLQGVRIGQGAIVGAGSLVTKDVPPYSIVYGSPARVKSWRPTVRGATA